MAITDMFDGVEHSLTLTFIPPSQIATWASHLRPHLEKMADGSGGRYLASDILASIAVGRMHAWVVMDENVILCCVVTEIISYPRRRAFRFVGLVGSSPRRWRYLLAAIETAAKNDFGCDLVEAVHLPRFAALLRGYRMTHWLSEKSV